jgi:galactose mutarotase-like enzyme
MLCCSFTHQGSELLDTGRGVAAYAEQGKTMGVPLLHPWANRLDGFGYEAAGNSVTLRQGDPRIPLDPNGLPIHGVMPGLLRWEAQRREGDSLAARLSWSVEELLEVFPYEHELAIEANVVDGELTIATTLRATGGDEVPVSFGYHPYLRLPGTSRDSWRMTLGASRRLVLDERMIPTGEREPLASRSASLQGASWDDGYDGLATPAEFEVAAQDAGIRVTFLEGYPFAQVYAPDGQDFVCFEPMTAPANALVSGDGLQAVAPGEEHRAVFAIRHWRG